MNVLDCLETEACITGNKGGGTSTDEQQTSPRDKNNIFWFGSHNDDLTEEEN